MKISKYKIIPEEFVLCDLGIEFHEWIFVLILQVCMALN
jgi:hypothetical protein